MLREKGGGQSRKRPSLSFFVIESISPSVLSLAAVEMKYKLGTFFPLANFSVLLHAPPPLSRFRRRCCCNKVYCVLVVRNRRRTVLMGPRFLLLSPATMALGAEFTSVPIAHKRPFREGGEEKDGPERYGS